MIIGSKIKLREKNLADAINDYAWQTDEELAKLDAVRPPTITFPQYFSDYTSELRYSTPHRRRFAIDTLDGKHIGNCVYYGIDEKKGEAELGIMIGNRDYWDDGYGTDAVTTLVSHIFQYTNLNRIYLKTLNSNYRAQSCFQKCGFTQYGNMAKDGHSFILMELYRKQWERRAREFDSESSHRVAGQPD